MGSYLYRLKKNKTTYEADWQDTIMQAAELNGWWAFHVEHSKGSPAGFLDCFLLRPPRLVCAELKDEKRQITPEQMVVMELLRGVPGIEVYLWRPNHDFDAIADILR